MKNILVVNVNWLGDVILSAPVFKNLRLAYPKARICCLAVSRVVPILKFIPDIDEVIELKEGVWQMPSMVLKLKPYKFDVAFFLCRSRSRALLAQWAGIEQRVGFAKKGNASLTHIVEDGNVQEDHRRDIYLKVLKSFGIPIPEKKTILKSPDLKDSKAKDFILVHVGANWDLKRWPVSNFVRCLNGVDNPIGFIGTRQEVSIVEQISKQLKKTSIQSFAGQTSIPQLMQLILNAKVLITADSGPMHMASSLGKPVIALFGPTKEELTGPCGPGKAKIIRYDVGCNRQSCYHLTCSDNICMQAITAKDVLDALEEIENS